MNKLTWSELVKAIDAHNNDYCINRQYEDEKPLSCVVVIKNSSFAKEYPLESRSYRFRSDNKFFLPMMMGRSIFADALDGTDDGVRLDWYLFGDDKDSCWEIEYCYIEDGGATDEK